MTCTEATGLLQCQLRYRMTQHQTTKHLCQQECAPSLVDMRRTDAMVSSRACCAATRCCSSSRAFSAAARSGSTSDSVPSSCTAACRAASVASRSLSFTSRVLKLCNTTTVLSSTASLKPTERLVALPACVCGTSSLAGLHCSFRSKACTQSTHTRQRYHDPYNKWYGKRGTHPESF